MLVRGMTDKEAQEFDASYCRAKRVLRRINEVARKEYLKILKEEEMPITAPEFGVHIARKMGERHVWNELQKLTRT